jgi:hypothetical protein
MNQYEAIININGRMVKTRVCAANSCDAQALFQMQYGSNNVIGFVVKVQ